jgi:inorganic triphosphatase YgiF
MKHEIELKVLLDADGETALRANPALGRLGKAKAANRLLHAVYFDTPDRALAKAGIALRVRKEGRAWIQTVKAGTGVTAGLSMPRESERPAAGGALDVDAIDDADLRDAVRAAQGDRPLSPAFEVSVKRTLRTLSSPHGGAVELAIDAGEIVAGGRREPIREAELELKSGDARDLFAVAEQLFPQGPVRFSRRNKAQRGYAVADGLPAVEPTPRAVTAAPVALKPDMTTEAAARDVLRGCLDQIAGNAAVAALSDAPDGPHQLRVGLRRLRTAAVVFASALGGPALDALEAEAQALAAAVGAVRDLDVLTEEVVAPFAGRDPGFAPLAEALAARRADARAAVRARLAAPETQRLIFGLGAFAEARGWLRPADFDQTARLAAPVAETAADALERRWRKAARLGDVIATLEGEARHDLRKALKKLRYTVEFFASLWSGKKVAPFLRRLKAMQEDFGALQDVAMARETLFGPDAPPLRDPDALRAAGFAVGYRQAEADRLWPRVVEDWAALAEAKRFWRG